MSPGRGPCPVCGKSGQYEILMYAWCGTKGPDEFCSVECSVQWTEWVESVFVEAP